MTEKEHMLSGQLYLADDIQLRRERHNTQKLLNQYNQFLPSESSRRKRLIRRIIPHAGKNCSVYPPFYCDYGTNIYIGDNFFANRNCFMLDVTNISIGDNVMIGPNVMILAASHPLDSLQRQEGYGIGLEVSIGNNVWIGAGSIINPGVNIGNNSVIGSGSVVSKDIPACVVAAGNPCRVIKTIDRNSKGEKRK